MFLFEIDTFYTKNRERHSGLVQFFSILSGFYGQFEMKNIEWILKL
jgi:hypothetical protein